MASKFKEAVNIILEHGMGRSDVELHWACREGLNGFLSCLRPYCGLRKEHFLEIMQALIEIGEGVAGESELDRSLVRAMVYIPCTARDSDTSFPQ